MALYDWQKTKYGRTWKIEVLGSGTADSLLVDKSPEYRFISPPTDKSPGVFPRELVVPIIDRDGDRGYLTDRLFDEVLDVELSLDGSLFFKGKSWAEDRRRPLLQEEYETKFVVTDRISELEDHTYDGNARTFNAFLREVLYKTGIELPIHLYTDWEEDSATGDLPDNHRVTIEEVDITYLEALNRFCDTFGFQIFQDGGVWVVRQVSYYTGNGITQWQIATDGTLTSSSVSGKDKSLTAPYKDESFDDALKGVGEARATFDVPVLEGEIENDAFGTYDGTDFESWDMTGTVSQVEDDDKFWARIEDESAGIEQRVERIVRQGDRLNITAEIRTNVSLPEFEIDFLRVWFIDSRDGSEYVVSTETGNISRVGSTNTFLYEHFIRVSTLNGIPLGFTGKVRFEYQFEDQGGYFTFYELDYMRCEFRINSAVNNRHVGEATAGPLTNREDVVLPIGENSDQYAEYEIEFNDGSWKPTQSWGGDSHYIKRAKDYLTVRNQNMNVVDYVFDLDEVDDMMAIYTFDGRSYLPVFMDITIGENDVRTLLVEHEVTSNTISTDEFFDNGGEDRVIGGSPSSTGGPGGGVTDHGSLTGLDDPVDHSWALQTDFSNIDWPNVNKSQFREDAGLQIGTDVQAHDAVLDDVASNDGSAALDLASLDVDNLGFDGHTISSDTDIILDAAGDVLINGDTIKVDKEMTTTDNVIVLNDGETGSGITAGEAGLQFDRGTETNYEILFQESNQLFSIGEVGSLQAVATRPDSPDDNGLAFWNDSEDWIETSADLTFDGSELSAPAISVDSPSDATNMEMNEGSVGLFFRGFNDNGIETFLLRNYDTDGVQFVLFDGAINVVSEGYLVDGDTVIDESRNVTAETGIFDDTLTGVDVDLSSTLDVGGVATLNDDVRIHESRLEYIHESGDGDLFFTRLDVDGNNSANLVFGRNFSFDDSDLDILTLNDSAGLDVHRVATFEDDITKDDFSLTTDFSGTGWEGTSEGDFNIRNLVVREAARFRELIIDQLSAVGGSFIYSAARGKVKENDSGTITLEDPNQQGVSQWAVDDIFVVRDVDIDGSEIQFITGRVSAITNPGAGSGNPTIDLVQDIAGTSGAISNISEGDVLVQRGNISDTDRQSLIYVTATDSDSPSQKMMDGIDSIAAFNDASNIVAQGGNIGNLNARYSEIGSGEFGYVSDNFYAAESFRVGDLNTDVNYLQYENDALTGVFDDLDFDSTTYTLTSQGGMVIDSASGIDLANGDFWHDDGLGSVGGGVLTWDGDASEVGLAAFTANEHYLTNGDVYIGNDLNSQAPIGDEGILAIGNFGDGSTPFIRINGVGGSSQNRIEMAPRTNSSDQLLEIIQDSNTVVDITGDAAQFFGAFVDAGAMWAGDADKGNATFLADWENQVLAMGSVFSADGSNDEGVLASLNVDSNHVWTEDGSGTAKTFTGLQPYADDSTKVIFGGADDKDGSNARAYIRGDGYLFSPSISDSLISSAAMNASYTTNPSDADTFDPDLGNAWVVSAVEDTEGEDSDSDAIVKRVRFRKKPGTTKLIFTFWAKQEISESGTGAGSSLSEVRFIGGVGSEDKTVEITSSDWFRHTIESDFAEADLFNEIDRIIEIEIYTETAVLDGTDYERETELFLNDNLIQLEQSV